MPSATHMVRVAILVGMAAGGTVQASMVGEGNSRTSREIVDTTMRSRLVSERQVQGAEDLHSRDRSLRGDDLNHDRHSGDRRGSGSSNSGPGSFNSGSRSDGNHGRRGGDDPRSSQTGDVKPEDRRADRQLDRRDNRQEDRRLDRREDRRANSGGELRGLDRANHVAGDHGQRGRDNAGAVQMDRGSRMERIERPDHSSRPERPERSGRN
ncbi:MAG: hypothetical protein AABZ34_10365 [Nitrospirota bacterium]